MNVDITGARIYFTIPIFGGIPITATIVNSLLVTLIIIGLSIFLTRNLKVRAVSRRQVGPQCRYTRSRMTFMPSEWLLFTKRVGRWWLNSWWRPRRIS